MQEGHGNSHARGVRLKSCERRMLSSTSRGRGKCPLRRERGRQGNTGKVVIKERIAATVTQGERIYRSVRGALLPQCERSVSTAMREENSNSHVRGAWPRPRERSLATAMQEKNAVINAHRGWRMPTKGRVWNARASLLSKKGVRPLQHNRSTLTPV